MRSTHAIWLMLPCSLLLASLENGKTAGTFPSSTDSLKPIAISARFVKHINRPCCCFVYIKGTDLFEINYASNGKKVTRLTEVEYDDCSVSPYKFGQYYTIIIKVDTQDSAYYDIVKYTTQESVRKKIKEELAPGTRIRN